MAAARTSFGSVMLLVLSVACFVVLLWIVMTVVRLLMGLPL